MPEAIATETAAAATTTATTATTGVANEPYTKDLFGSDWTVNHSAIERLPAHLKGAAPLLQNTKNFDDILMRWEQANNLASKKALAPLLPNAPKEVVAERSALLDAMNGVPADAKAYGLTRDALAKDLPEAQWNQDLADAFAGWAKENHVSPDAARKLVGIQGGFVKAQLAAHEQYVTQFWAKEQTAFDNWAATKNITSDRASALLDKAVIGLGLDPKDKQTSEWLKSKLTRQALIEHAISTSEDTSHGSSTGGSPEGNDYAALAASVRSDTSNPMYAVYRNIGGKFSRGDVEAAQAKVHEWDRLALEQANRKAARRGA